MAVRSVVGWIMMGSFWWLLRNGPDYVASFLVFGQLMTWKEVVSLSYKVTKEIKLWGFRTLNWLAKRDLNPNSQALPRLVGSATGNDVPHLKEVCEFLVEYNDAVTVALYACALMLFVWSLQTDTLKYQIHQLAWTIVALLLVVGQSQFALRYAYQALVWILLPHGLIMVNDIMAYFCGIAFGRRIIDRPLFRLSPKKTWEGFIGALLCTLGFAFFVSPYLLGEGSEWLYCPYYQQDCEPNPVFIKTTYVVPKFVRDVPQTYVKVPETVELFPLQLHAIVLSLFASLVAPFGGFLASAIKRAYEAKDYAALFPGHGGFMDRVDCQFMMCTFTYVYLKTFIYKGTPWAAGHDELSRE